MSAPLTTFSTLRQAWQEGDSAAGDALARLVYQQLHFLASHYLRQEAVAPSLQTTELINEAWLRLFGAEPLTFENRAHFFVIAARQMRRILIDRVRGAQAQRRIPKTMLLPLQEAQHVTVQSDEFWLALEEALQQLEQEVPRTAQVVELRYFAGLTEAQTAEILSLSIATIRREWAFARTWLYDRLYRTEAIPSIRNTENCAL